MNINDVYMDKAMVESVVITTIDTMIHRGYPLEIQERLARLKLDIDGLYIELVQVINKLQTPATPGIPGLSELPE